MSDRYQKLRELLEQEEFPRPFIFKFIGKTTEAFFESVRTFQALNPELLENTRQHSGSGRYVSLTFTYQAESSAGIIAIYQAIEAIRDVEVIL